MIKPSLPTVEELIERQLVIQAQIEQGEISIQVGTGHINNLQKIITGVEIAEQLSEEEPKNEVAPTFSLDETVTEESVKLAMTNLYRDLETGHISPQKALGRLKVLEAMGRVLKPQTLINQQLGIQITNTAVEAEQKESTRRLSEIVTQIGNRIRDQGESLIFATNQLARLTQKTPAQCMEAILAKKEVKPDAPLRKKGSSPTTH